MSRTIESPELGYRRARRTVGVATAVALPILAPIIAGALAVASITVSPNDVGGGGGVTGTVTLDSVPLTVVQVALASSNTAVATVQSSIDLGGKLGSRGTFPVTTVAGFAGCSTISAKVGTTAKSAVLYVEPPAPSADLKLSLAANAVSGGATVSGTLLVTVNNTHPGTTVQLASNSPSATVPSSVNLTLNEMGVGTATFTVSTVRVPSATCAVITATHGTQQSRVLLKLNPLFVG